MAERTCRFCKKKFDANSDEAIVMSKTIAYCSIECVENEKFESVLMQKSTKKLSTEENKYRIQILEYIKDRSNNCNTPAIAAQIKNLIEEFDITYKQLYNTIMYAEKYENYTYDPAFGARQLDKFVLPTIKYMAELARLKKIKYTPIKEANKPTTKGRIIKPFLKEEDETLEDD